MMKDIYKIVLLGESGVGKTCILEQFINGKFDLYEVSSQTVKFFRKTLEFPEGKSLNFDIWDTPGQEKHRSINKIFYKQANVVILVYDVTNEESFTEMKDYWYEQIKQLGDKDIILAIAANKSDLYEEKQVSNETGEEFANQIGAIFASTSAKNGSGIQALFYNIGQKIFDPNFDFSSVEKKKKDEYKKKKQQDEKKDQPAPNKGVKITAQSQKKEKKKGGC